MDRFSWQAPFDKLAPVVKEAQAKLRLLDREELARQSGATSDAQGNLRISFLGREYVLNHEFMVTRVDQESTPSSLWQSLLLAYLYTADGTPPSDRWLGFRELPNGLFYAQAFQSYTGATLIRELQGDIAAFKRAGERLRGTILTRGNIGYAFPVLPRLSLAVVMWLGDEDFPAQAQVLFPENAPHYLSTEGLAIVGSLLIGQIVKVAAA